MYRAYIHKNIMSCLKINSINETTATVSVSGKMHFAIADTGPLTPSILKLFSFKRCKAET